MPSKPKKRNKKPGGARRKTPAPSGLGRCRMRHLPLTSINAAPYNPRAQLEQGDPDYERLAQSIREFGLVTPLVWNERNSILVGGHQGLTVLRNQGAKSVDVVVVNLDPQRERLLNLALNKITGRWDDDKLAVMLRDLKTDETVDELLSGFDAGEIDKLVDGLAAELGGDDAPPQDPGKASGDPAPQALRKVAWRIVIDCADQEHQEKLLARFVKQGITCRPLIR